MIILCCLQYKADCLSCRHLQRLMKGPSNSGQWEAQALLTLCRAVQPGCSHTLLLLLVAILDIPVYKSRIQPLHILFSLYSEFKNSQVCSSRQAPLYQLEALQSFTPYLWPCYTVGVHKGLVDRGKGIQRKFSKLLISLVPQHCTRSLQCATGLRMLH